MSKFVDIVVDRPIGYTDRFGNVYPINYGYVPGILGGDGEEQDVYILDIKAPLEKFHGEVIAIIERANDNETKWVVSERKHNEKEIYEQVEFMEKYFDSIIKML